MKDPTKDIIEEYKDTFTALHNYDSDPTNEGWEKEFDEAYCSFKFSCDETQTISKPQLVKLKNFIQALLTEERAKEKNYWMNQSANEHDNATRAATRAEIAKEIKENLAIVTEERAKAEAAGVDHVRVGMLRQWINEDRIINNPKKTLISNEEILYWLMGNETHLTLSTEAKKESV